LKNTALSKPLEILTKDDTGEAGHVKSSKLEAYYKSIQTPQQSINLPTNMAALGEDLLGVVNKLQDLVFNTIGNDSLDLPQIVCHRLKLPLTRSIY